MSDPQNTIYKFNSKIDNTHTHTHSLSLTHFYPNKPQCMGKSSKEEVFFNCIVNCRNLFIKVGRGRECIRVREKTRRRERGREGGGRERLERLERDETDIQTDMR